MRTVSQIKGSGYLTSTVSVFLLAVPGWKSASQDPMLFACLLVGMALSIGGMGLRWRSHRMEQKEKDRDEARERRPATADNRSYAAVGTSASR